MKGRGGKIINQGCNATKTTTSCVARRQSCRSIKTEEKKRKVEGYPRIYWKKMMDRGSMIIERRERLVKPEGNISLMSMLRGGEVK